MLYVLGKIQIISGKGTSHIIVHLVTAFCHLLKLGNDLIIASLSATERTHAVMYLSAAVDTQNNIAHLPVQEFLNLII